MAKGSTTEAPDLSGLLGLEIEMEDVTEDNAIQIKSTRGRQEGQDIVALRNILRQSLSTNTAKVFTGVTDDTMKETLTRKVRQAGKGAGPNGEDVKVSTSYDRNGQRLFWGPKSVIDSLTKKGN